jgi:uncharacterized protein
VRCSPVARFEGCDIACLLLPGVPRLELYLATGVRRRLLGLSRLERERVERGVLIPRCASIHTLSMRFPIDVVFVTWPAARGCVQVLGLRERLPPLRFASAPGRARRIAVAELLPGTVKELGLVPKLEIEIEVARPSPVGP